MYLVLPSTLFALVKVDSYNKRQELHAEETNSLKVCNDWQINLRYWSLDSGQIMSFHGTAEVEEARVSRVGFLDEAEVGLKVGVAMELHQWATFLTLLPTVRLKV